MVARRSPLGRDVLRADAVELQLVRRRIPPSTEGRRHDVRVVGVHAPAADEITGEEELQRPLLASTHGGEILVKQSQHGSLVAQDALYRVIVRPLGEVPKADAVIAGRVRIETSFRFLAENFAYKIISIFIRESGI